MMKWTNNVSSLKDILESLSVCDGGGKEYNQNRAFAHWKDTTLQIRENRKTVFLIGNGASASMASHIAADLAKNAHVHTQVFTDLSLITSIANDVSYEEVYAEPLRRRMTRGDMLVAISSSGQSPNILKAVSRAKDLGGFLVTLSAMSAENTLRSLGTINFYVPAKTYGMAETCHATILHYWVDEMTNSNV